MKEHRYRPGRILEPIGMHSDQRELCHARQRSFVAFVISRGSTKMPVWVAVLYQESAQGPSGPLPIRV